MQERQKLLQSLLNYTSEPVAVQQALQAFPWDVDEALIELRPNHITSVLARYLNQELNAEQIEDWANAIESRDDIDMSDALIEVIHQLANPILTTPLTKEEAERLIGQLHEPS